MTSADAEHIKQPHRDLLTHRDKYAPHQGQYGTSTTSVMASDEGWKQLGQRCAGRDVRCELR